MATELGKAYVQIIPSAKGIQGSISDAIGGEAKSAGKSAGTSIAGAIKTAIIAAGIGKVIGAALTEGAALEQSLGGVETLFKENADEVIANAERAYKTAGVSANSYMETVTSFSATLLQGLGGDTAAAAKIADQALIDMSDNANKMGTDMETIQYAYQGFAKDNYEMLDNLKLGYGGTQAEMARLINDSGVLGDAVEVTAESVKDVPFDKVIEAIHVIQSDLGITGTTALEAATTFSGSFASMQAAAQNFLGKLMLGQELEPALTALTETVVTFLAGNFLPAIWNILSALPEALVVLIQTLVPQLVTTAMEFIPKLLEGITIALPQIVTAIMGLIPLLAQGIATAAPQLWEMAKTIVANLVTGMVTELPKFLEKGSEAVQNMINGISQRLPDILHEGSVMLQSLIRGILNVLPNVVSAAFEIITAFLMMIVDNLPAILDEGAAILLTLVQGILGSLPEILSAAGDMISTLLSGLIERLPDIISAGFELVSSLIRGIGEMLPDIGTAAGQLVRKLWDTITNINWIQLGKDIIWGIISGIGSMAGALWDAAWNIASSALNAIKSFFGIASPSKVMRDEVGRFIPSGLAVGIEANTEPVESAMRSLSDMTTDSLQRDINAALIPAAADSAAYTPAAPSGVVITVNVYGAQGQDVMSLARAVSRVLQDELEQKELVFA